MPRRLISIQDLMRLVFVAAVILAVLQTGDMRLVYGALAVAFMAPWIVEPIRQRATQWLDPAVTYEPFELDDPDLSPVVVESLQHTEPALRSLGFELRGRFRRAGSGPAEVTGHVALFEHPTTFEQARVIASVARTTASLWLMFRTEYKDGTDFSTTNGRFPRVLPHARQHRPGSMAFPQVRGVRLLHAIHTLRAEPEGRVEVGIDDPVERLVRDARLERSAWLDAGYYRPEPGSTRWRLTWKGAILMSWKLLWPVPQTRLAWRRWRAARFLRGIGVGEAA